MDLRKRILFAGHLLFLVGALVATLLAIHQRPKSGTLEGSTLGAPERHRGPVVQLPRIVARLEQGEMLVYLRNDTEDQQVVIDAVSDQLLVEYPNASGGITDHIVRVPGCTLGPGQKTEAIRLALSERVGPATVEFVFTEGLGSATLVARTHVTVP